MEKEYGKAATVRCTECGSTDMWGRSGELVCDSCGLVQEKKPDMWSEHRKDTIRSGKTITKPRLTTCNIDLSIHEALKKMVRKDFLGSTSSAVRIGLPFVIRRLMNVSETTDEIKRMKDNEEEEVGQPLWEVYANYTEST